MFAKKHRNELDFNRVLTQGVLKMKNIYLNLTLLALFTTIGVRADEKVTTTKVTIKTETLEETPFIEYHNRAIVFMPLHQGYERIKNDSLYWGLEAWVSCLLNHNHKRNDLLNGEVRMGYNFFYNGRDHLTPFAGVGFIQNYHIKHHHHHYHVHHKTGVLYGALGFLYDHAFTSVFNLGLNAKGLLGGPVHDKHHGRWGSPVVGADVSIPITFRFGRNRHWDFRVEPFNTYLYGPDSSAYYVGFRNSLGYRF